MNKIQRATGYKVVKKKTKKLKKKCCLARPSERCIVAEGKKAIFRPISQHEWGQVVNSHIEDPVLRICV